jgi:hypothetical protein
MIEIVKGSALEEQIELARREIEQWPKWLRIASRMESFEDEGTRSSSANAQEEKPLPSPQQPDL